jgi:hypothetical protein
MFVILTVHLPMLDGSYREASHFSRMLAVTSRSEAYARAIEAIRAKAAEQGWHVADAMSVTVFFYCEPDQGV